LEQDKASDVRRLFENTQGSELFITGFSLYSLGIVLFRLKKETVFNDFLSDVLEEAGLCRIVLTTSDLRRVVQVRQRFDLDFDDAYQYAAALKHQLVIVSYDSDFDRTELGRKTPPEALQRVL